MNVLIYLFGLSTIVNKSFLNPYLKFYFQFATNFKVDLQLDLYIYITSNEINGMRITFLELNLQFN